MTVFYLLKKYLKDNNCIGLCTKDCSCSIEELGKCGDPWRMLNCCHPTTEQIEKERTIANG